MAPLPSINLWPHQTKAPPPNEREWLLSFLEHFYRLFFGVLPKLECRVSLSMVHIHPGAEWQEAGHQLPSQTAFKGFSIADSCNIGRGKWGSTTNKSVCQVYSHSACQSLRMYLVMYTLCRYCAIAASTLDKQLKIKLS